MDELLMNVKWQIALVYLDNTAIFSRRPDKHIAHVLQVVTLLIDTGMALNLKKCKLLIYRINNLDYFTGPGHLEVLTRKIDALHGYQKLPTARNSGHSLDLEACSDVLFQVSRALPPTQYEVTEWSNEDL